MNEILTNVTTIIAILSIIITSWFAIRTIRESRASEKGAQTSGNDQKAISDGYNDILKVTHDLEFNREKNSGEHFEDESVYLHRANQIRINSPFFSWVK